MVWIAPQQESLLKPLMFARVWIQLQQCCINMFPHASFRYFCSTVISCIACCQIWAVARSQVFCPPRCADQQKEGLAGSEKGHWNRRRVTASKPTKFSTIVFGNRLFSVVQAFFSCPTKSTVFEQMEVGTECLDKHIKIIEGLVNA